MRQNFNYLIYTLLAFCFFNIHFLQATPIKIPFIAVDEITIDAQLSESIWQQALKIELNNTTSPEENTPAPVATTAYLLTNKESLFIAFVATDPNPEQIKAYYRDRDKVWEDDLVGIKIDSFHDQRLAYEFFANPYGVQLDAIENEITQSESDAWDAIWDSAGRVTESGFIVEMVIPLRNINFPQLSENSSVEWGIELVRFYPREQRLRLSHMQIDFNNRCKICQMPTAILPPLKPTKNLVITPALVTNISQSRDIESHPHERWQTKKVIEPSLDIKWGISPSLTINSTLNPDFSQVEADVAQLSVNNTFALFFPEKRTFFLDNIDYFSTNLDFVYTRNIAEPDYGFKLTGREGDHAYGLFVANDKNTSFLVPGNVGSSFVSFDEESQNSAFRYRYDFSNDFSIGLVNTLRQASGYHNYTLGTDIKYKLSASDTFNAQWVYAETEYPEFLQNEFCDEEDCRDILLEECRFGDCATNEQVLRLPGEDKLHDSVLKLAYVHESREWRHFIDYVDYGDQFRGDLGFLDRTDFNKFVAGSRRTWRQSTNNWWHRFEIGGDWDITHNENRELIEKEAQVYVRIFAKKRLFSRIDLVTRNRIGERNNPGLLAIDQNSFLFSEQLFAWYTEFYPINTLFLSTQIDVGDQIDFANNRLGKGRTIRSRAFWDVSEHTKVELRHTYSTLRAERAKVFTANLIDLRLTYNFSAKSLLKLTTVYRDTSRDPDNYLFSVVDKKTETLSNQLLYSYKINPQTLFFAGYTDNASAEDSQPHLTQTERSLFFKVSYAFL